MKTLEELFAEMSALTAPECAKSCRVPHSCCSVEYCEGAAYYAKTHYNVTLEPTGHPTLPFMGPTGCIVPPHMRPVCTIHTCDIGGLGFKRDDPGGVWTKKYFKLRNAIDNKIWREE